MLAEAEVDVSSRLDFDSGVEFADLLEGDLAFLCIVLFEVNLGAIESSMLSLSDSDSESLDDTTILNNLLNLFLGDVTTDCSAVGRDR